MNEQNGDSFLSENETPLSTDRDGLNSIETKDKKQGILDSIWHLWHKHSQKSHTDLIHPETISIEVSSTPVVLWLEKDKFLEYENNSWMDVQEHVSLKKKIREKLHALFPKKTVSERDSSEIKSEQIQSIKSQIDPSIIEEEWLSWDEKFHRLLKLDTTYHSMIRSEDIKNIELQLSMRYMLLVFVIFVIVTWSMQNRVIADFSLFLRLRDALFGLLTWLFSLTIWFGSSVWFHNKIIILIMKMFAISVCVFILFSVYLPFWR